MKQVIFSGKFKTLAPFCSSDPTDKNTNEVETRKISVHYDGKKDNIPFLSPNTIRSNLRDNIAKDIVEKFPNQIGYRELLFLTSGGNLEGKEEKGKALKTREVFERIKEIRENNIVASIFGGALFHLNKLIPGKLSCGVGYLICKETMKRDDLPSFETYVGKELQFVRSDDTDRWEFFSALSEEGIKDKEEYEIKYKESAKQRQEEKKKKTNGVKTENTEGILDASQEEEQQKEEQKKVPKIASSQMIWEIKDYVVEGATFKHELLLVNPTLREVGAIIRAYERFSEFPYLGCFKNIGFGKMQIEYTIKAIENDEKTELGYIKIEDIKKFGIDGDGAIQALAEYKEYLNNLTYDMIRI